MFVNILVNILIIVVKISVLFFKKFLNLYIIGLKSVCLFVGWNLRIYFVFEFILVSFFLVFLGVNLIDFVLLLCLNLIVVLLFLILFNVLLILLNLDILYLLIWMILLFFCNFVCWVGYLFVICFIVDVGVFW